MRKKWVSLSTAVLPPVDVSQVLLSYFSGILQIRALWNFFLFFLQWKPESSKISILWLKDRRRKKVNVFIKNIHFSQDFYFYVVFSISVAIYTWLLYKLCGGYFRSFLSPESWIIFPLMWLTTVSLSRQSMAYFTNTWNYCSFIALFQLP